MDGDIVSYTYDGMGNILTETEGNTVKSYTYDSRGRKSGYTLTIAGETISTATYAYDTSNRLTSVTEGGKTTTYTYDANGNRASQTTDGVTTTYTYNKANLVTGMTNKMGDVVISSFTYTYYADGNMHTKAETQLDVTTNTTYVYDGVGRLKSETKDDSTIAYYYDANGNRTLMNNDGVITSYTYDKNNRLLTEGDIVYTYDANGNTLTAGDKEYTYNYRGQQIGYSDGTTTATYAYNPGGLRSAKTVGGSTKYFVYNGMQIVFEYEDSVSDGTTYYYGLNRTHSSDGDIFVYNAHGDTVQLVNNNAVAANYTYDAFGNLINTVGASDNAFLYCSEYFDAETQTYYLRARYYNPANGRFTQQDAWAFMDTSDPLTLNLYTYCANNPILYVDPSGESYIDDMKNDDGSYALYDNKRFNPESCYREQILSGNVSAPSFNLKDGKIGFGSLEVNVYTGGWEFENADLSLLDVGSASIGAEFDEDGVYVGAIASAWSPSASVRFWGIELEVSAEVGAVGVELEAGKKGFSFGFAATWGFSISISF